MVWRVVASCEHTGWVEGDEEAAAGTQVRIIIRSMGVLMMGERSLRHRRGRLYTKINFLNFYHGIAESDAPGGIIAESYW